MCLMAVADGRNSLQNLDEYTLGRDLYYKSMQEDAFDVAVHYANAADLIGTKDYYRKDGKVDMCTGIKEWIADERAEGKAEGKIEDIVELLKEIGMIGESGEAALGAERSGNIA